MLETTPSLPDDPVLLHGIIAQLSGQLVEAQRAREEQAQRIDQLLEAIALLRRKRFGPSADRVPEGQLSLFDEAELETLIGELEAQLPAATPGVPDGDGTTPAAAATAPKRTPARAPLPAQLPRVERILDLPAAEKAAMGEDWGFIGYDRSEQLAVIPRQVYVIAYLRAKYAPQHADVPGAAVGVKIAPRAAQIIPKSIAHHSLLAAVITSKFVDGLPLTAKSRCSPARGSHSAAKPWPGC